MPRENLHHRGHEGTQRKPQRKPRKELTKKRKSGMPSENLHHRGHEGTQRKTTEETVEKQGEGNAEVKTFTTEDTKVHKRNPMETVEGKPQRKASKKTKNQRGV